jgi:D-alanyl-D-alanine carboxypeptidase/D-alanyl-D-alanine-endopeptidase (penicillin-binding protein 4)
VLSGCVLSGCALAPPRADGTLPAAVQAALDAAGVPATAFAGAALPLGHHAPAWHFAAERPLQPASTMKLLTSIVALDRLGPNHRTGTEFASVAPLADGVLQGDLVLRGGADVDLGVPQFWALLLELRALGIERIAGDVVVDRTLFRPARMDLGVPPFDDAPEFPYNVIPDALNLAGALLPLDLRSDGERVVARTVPPLPGIELEPRLALADRPCSDWSGGWAPAQRRLEAERVVVELHGSFPRHCAVRAHLQLVDRQRLTEALFRALWTQLGGRLDGRVREGAAPAAPGLRVLARRQARPLAEVLRTVNKRSDNPVTRLVFLSLGEQARSAGPAQGSGEVDTAELAAREVAAWLAAQGIAAPGLVVDNGSGLSRRERISPQTLAEALRTAWHGRHASELLMSMPQVGSETAAALKDSPAAAWARMKPGTLRNVVALAGYVKDPEGRPWALAMMINHDDARRARGALLAMVDHVARAGVHARPPAGAAPAPGPRAAGHEPGAVTPQVDGP